MGLSQKQKGVLKGMILSLIISVAIIIIGITTDPFPHLQSLDNNYRFFILGISILFPTLFLVVSIGRLAKHRFFTPEDIDGSGLTQGSAKATLLQSLLQNTLEQLAITLAIYTAWCALMPLAWLSAIPLCSIAFAIGRVSFFAGYKKGAPSRAFGFALTFYPSVFLLFIMLGYLIIDYFI